MVDDALFVCCTDNGICGVNELMMMSNIHHISESKIIKYSM